MEQDQEIKYKKNRPYASTEAGIRKRLIDYFKITNIIFLNHPGKINNPLLKHISSYWCELSIF
jgi:competence protein ComGF